MIAVKNLNIKQGDFLLSNINLSIEKGEYVVLMGKTGCGKSTLMEAICGLRKVDSGEVWLNEKEITNLVPGQREIGYVSQDGALFSHLTVARNIGFALKLRRWSKLLIDERVTTLAKAFGIDHLLERNVTKLSGGEKQRVAMARAMSFNPLILCLDEPMSALDEETKESMFELLENLKQNMGITILHVSHSKAEAERLADRVFKLNKGVLV